MNLSLSCARGPNIFKPELDDIFEEYGVKPEYY